MRSAAEILNETLSQRKLTNPRYSLRSFARDLGISAPQLSNVISGNRGLSFDVAEKVVSKLGLSVLYREIFHTSLRAGFALSPKERIASQKTLIALHREQKGKSLDLEKFKVISNWHHFAILELLKITAHSKQTASQLGRRLGVSENEISIALQRLEKLNLIKKLKLGYSVNQSSVIADQVSPAESIHHFHRQILQKSLDALMNQSSDTRYGYSAAMPMKVSNVEKVKSLIQRFRHELSDEVTSADGDEEIFGLTFQFFQLTQLKEGF